MEQADRLQMRIDGRRVCEIDIRASYLTIFHALYGESFDATKDPYVVPGLGEEGRDAVKMWITASFGNNAPITKWPRELVAKYREKTGKTLGKRYAASKVSNKVMQAFPLLARLGEVVNGIARGWAELMYIESRAMFWTMADLVREGYRAWQSMTASSFPASSGIERRGYLRSVIKSSQMLRPF